MPASPRPYRGPRPVVGSSRPPGSILTLEYLDEALAEAEEAARWYASRNPQTAAGLVTGRSDSRRRDARRCMANEVLVGATGFEPATTGPPVRCATGLRYAPTNEDDLRRKRGALQEVRRVRSRSSRSRIRRRAPA